MQPLLPLSGDGHRGPSSGAWKFPLAAALTASGVLFLACDAPRLHPEALPPPLRLFTLVAGPAPRPSGHPALGRGQGARRGRVHAPLLRPPAMAAPPGPGLAMWTDMHPHQPSPRGLTGPGPAAVLRVCSAAALALVFGIGLASARIRRSGCAVVGGGLRVATVSGDTREPPDGVRYV